MTKLKSEFNAADLLERLEHKKLTDDKELPSFVASLKQMHSTPIYAQVLYGIGAFITMFFFASFFFSLFNIFNQQISILFFGLLNIIVALVLIKGVGNNKTNNTDNIFITQLTFISMATGKALIVIGVFDIVNSLWTAPLTLLIVTLTFYRIYPISLDRFLSSLGVLLLVWLNILWGQEFIVSTELWFNAFFLLQALSATVLIINPKIKRDFRPIAYALFFSLCFSVLVLASYNSGNEQIQTNVSSIALAGGLIALIAWIAGDVKKLICEPLLVAVFGIIVLGAISTIGIMLSIGLMIIGFAQHERLLLLTGTLLMPVFLFLYYYNLEVSLLEKAGIVIGCGAILLAGKLYLKLKGWDKEIEGERYA